MKKLILLLFCFTLLSACSPKDGKRYIHHDPNLCKSILFQCEDDSKPFFDEKGCGCVKVIEGKSDEDLKNMACPEIYQPVCAKIQVQCITTPCDPVEQTFPNDCYAKKAKGIDIRDGACN